MPPEREDVFNQYSNFTLFFFLFQISSPWVGVIQFLLSIPYRCYISNLTKIGPVVLEKMLTDDDGRQPIALGHLCDSGDLKTTKPNIKHIVIDSLYKFSTFPLIKKKWAQKT